MVVRLRSLAGSLLLWHAFSFSQNLAAAEFSFSLSTPIQCSNLTVNIVGGSPPYELLILPIGFLQVETRRIIDINSTSTSITFPLNFPAQSQFLAVLSDATGVGVGGTGINTTVAASDISSCLTLTPNPDFFFYMTPTNQLTQCTNSTLSWNSSAEGHVSIYGVIPGGTTFRLDPPTGNTAFQWLVNVRAGTVVELVAGDSRGIGTGGSSELITVQDGPSGCINSDSPSSTAGSPAGSVTGGASPSATTSGGSVITAAPTSGSSGGSGGGRTTSSSNTGAIAGGVVGGIVGLAILAGLIFFFCFRRDREPEEEQGEVDLMTGEESPNRAAPTIEAGFYRHEPFVVPEPGSSGGQASSEVLGAYTETSTPAASVLGPLGAIRDRRSSQQSAAEMTQSSSEPATTLLTRTNLRDRKLPPSAMRAVNLGQHEDVGEPSSDLPAQEDAEQVVELPPTYASVRKPGSSTEDRSPT